MSAHKGTPVTWKRSPAVRVNCFVLVSAEGFAAQHSFALQLLEQPLLARLEGEAVLSRKALSRYQELPGYDSSFLEEVRVYRSDSAGV